MTLWTVAPRTSPQIYDTLSFPIRRWIFQEDALSEPEGRREEEGMKKKACDSALPVSFPINEILPLKYSQASSKSVFPPPDNFI